MKTTRVMLTALAAMLFLASGPDFSRAESGVSDWAHESSSSVRLVAGPRSPDGSYLAGFEFRLEPGWKTYWVNPGTSGFPPRFDWSASQNLAGIEVGWPAPKRFDDGGSVSAGYSGSVILPLHVRPKDPTKPVLLRAAVEYGICENICVPARASLALDFSPDAKPDALAAVRLGGFAARVPVAAALGGEGALAVVSVRREKAALSVEVRFPPGSEDGDLFAIARGGEWSGIPKRVARSGSSARYRIEMKAGSVPPALDLVAVADQRAIKVPVTLDATPSTP